jgi:hypothetical protein
MKELYTYKVNRNTIKENKVKNEDGSVTITEVTESVPVEVFMKFPSRRDREEMQTIYNQEFHKCISNGINSNDMLKKVILDANAGHYSKQELEILHELYKKLNAAALEYTNKKLDGDDAADEENAFNKIHAEIYKIESSQKSIFDKSAETLSFKKYVTWAAINLTFLKNEKEFDSVFRGPTFMTKLDNYYDMSDEPEKYQFELNCFDKSYLLYERYLTKDIETKEDFERMEKEIDKFLNTPDLNI